ncbi:MAG: zeta toxin family protein [Microbacterium sp.]|uniref:zeta toxin family protein n=1 Tax=Microbacterium sp. TaxID=51671 RepID=UPI003F98B0E4
MKWREDLSAAELREIFDRKIAPTLTAGGAAELHPAIVFVGAQPGAGKSRAIAAVRDEHTGATPVIGDDFRAFHPDYRALMRTEPLAMPHVTAQASGAWVGMAADYLRGERRSVILETTMRQLPVVETTAAAFRAQGYRVEAHVLAVPGAVSALGTVSRYLGEAAGNDQNRWTPSAAHEAAYEAMPVTVEQLVARGLIDRVTVTTRAQAVLYDRAVTGDTAVTVSVEARRAVEAGRSPAVMTSREGREWVRTFAVAAARVSHLPEVADDLHETMRRLAAAGAEIIQHTHEPAMRAAARETVTSADIPTGRLRSAADREQARWWGVDVDRAPTRPPGEIAARSARDTQGTSIAADIAKNRSIGRDR